MLFDYSTFKYPLEEFVPILIIALFVFGLTFWALLVFFVHQVSALKKFSLRTLLLTITSGLLTVVLITILVIASNKSSQLREIDYNNLISNIEETYEIEETTFSNSTLWDYKKQKVDFLTDPLTMTYSVNGKKYYDSIVFEIFETSDGRFLKVLSGNDRLVEFIPQNTESKQISAG